MCPTLPYYRALFRSSHLRYNVGSGQASELDGKISHPAGGPGHQDTSLQQQPTLRQGIERRQACYRERGRLGQRDGIRQHCKRMSGHGNGLGPGPAGQQTNHPRPWLWSRPIGSGVFDYTCQVPAWPPAICGLHGATRFAAIQ
jgi:hypothetical protein